MSLLWKIGIGFVLGIVLGFTVGPSVALFLHLYWEVVYLEL